MYAHAFTRPVHPDSTRRLRGIDLRSEPVLDVALAFKNSVKETRASSTFPGITNARRFRAGPKLKTGFFSDGGLAATERVT